VERVQEELHVSERRACQVVGQPRSTQRRAPVVRDDDERVRAAIVGLACQFGRYGTPRVTALLHADGWHINHKRVERIWTEEGLKVPRKQPRRKRLWLNDGSCVRLRPTHRDHVWSYDFVMTRTEDGRPVKMLTLLDEYTRECLSITVARRLTSAEVLQQLEAHFIHRRIPEYIRSDNGAEFTAQAVRDWLAHLGVRTLFIEPGSPWENGYCESFNGKLRDECLNREVFTSLLEARVVIEQWRVEYNTIRPHSALGYRPPAPETTMPLGPRVATLPGPPADLHTRLTHDVVH